MFSNTMGKYESIESIDDWKSGLFVTRSNTQKKQLDNSGDRAVVREQKREKYESIDDWKSGMFITRSDTQKKQLDESGDRTVVREHERQPSLTCTVNSDDESACFDLIDDMISDDELSIYSGNNSQNDTIECHSDTGGLDLTDDSDENGDRVSLCDHERQLSRSFTCTSDDESTGIDIIDDMISDDELSIVSGNKSNNGFSIGHPDTTASINLNDMISDDDLSLDSDNETHNSTILHDHNRLRMSSTVTAKIRNGEHSSINFYATSSTSKTPIRRISVRPTSPATAIVSDRSSLSQRIIDKKKKLRTLELQYSKQKLELINKPLQQKPYVSINVNEVNKIVQRKPDISVKVKDKELNTCTYSSSRFTPTARSGLKQTLIRNAKKINYHLILCFLFLICAFYKDALTKILRNKQT